MHETILQKIKETLEGISAIKEIHTFPLEGNPKKFPAAIFFFKRFDNTFETTKENALVMNFKLYLVVNEGGSSMEAIYGTVMPRLIDAVVAKFNADWNFGRIGNHRVWMLLTDGDMSVSVEQQGKTVTADLTIQVKLSTSA